MFLLFTSFSSLKNCTYIEIFYRILRLNLFDEHVHLSACIEIYISFIEAEISTNRCFLMAFLVWDKKPRACPKGLSNMNFDINSDFDIHEVEKQSNVNIVSVEYSISENGFNSNMIFKDFYDLCRTCII